MRILLVIDSIRISGTEKLMTAVAKELTPAGCEFFICPLITPFDEEFRKWLESDGYKLNILLPETLLRFDSFFWRLNGISKRVFNWSFRDWFIARHVSKMCRKLDVQLIVSNSHVCDMFSLEINKRTDLPVVIVDHGGYAGAMVEGEKLDPVAIEKSHAIVAVSRWSQQLLTSRFPHKKIVQIYNAVVPGNPYKDQSTRQVQPLPCVFTFCMHGRDTEQKGWDIAIESFLKLKTLGYNARLVLLCAGPYIETLKKKYGNNDDIVFAGFMYNIEEAISYVDAGLLMSKRFEAFGISILDYFQQGKPVIASNVGAIPEVMRDGNLSGGILVDVDNGIARESEIVNAMQKLIDDKQTYTRLSEDGRQIAKRFDIKTCATAYLSLFRSVINERKGKSI